MTRGRVTGVPGCGAMNERREVLPRELRGLAERHGAVGRFMNHYEQSGKPVDAAL